MLEAMMMEKGESSDGIEKVLLDQLLAGCAPSDVFARDGLLDDLKKALSERILNAELDKHLVEDRADGGILLPLCFDSETKGWIHVSSATPS